MLELIGSLVVGFAIGTAIGGAIIAVLELMFAIGRAIQRTWWYICEMAEIAFFHFTGK